MFFQKDKAKTVEEKEVQIAKNADATKLVTPALFGVRGGGGGSSKARKKEEGNDPDDATILPISSSLSELLALKDILDCVIMQADFASSAAQKIAKHEGADKDEESRRIEMAVEDAVTLNAGFVELGIESVKRSLVKSRERAQERGYQQEEGYAWETKRMEEKGKGVAMKSRRQLGRTRSQSMV